MVKEKKEATKSKVIKKEALPKATPSPKPKGRMPLAQCVGRRKKAIARVCLTRGSGKITVNGKQIKTYFDTDIDRTAAAFAFQVCPVSSNYDVLAKVQGGGKTSQADAVKLGIARALVHQDETLRPLFRKYRMLTVDSRVKERKKYGQKAARRKFQFVKR
ncbi:MAG: 30S ribosomal protein S9 [bacterium]|nr:30S ribosomal protein S9 [bacterium]